VFLVLYRIHFDICPLACQCWTDESSMARVPVLVDAKTASEHLLLESLKLLFERKAITCRV